MQSSCHAENSGWKHINNWLYALMNHCIDTIIHIEYTSMYSERVMGLDMIAITQGSITLNSSCQAQMHTSHRSFVFVVKQLQPHPEAHSVSVSNHNFMCWTWPPWPQVTHSAAGPLTPERHKAHFSFCLLQLSHHELRYASKQVPQVNERADNSGSCCAADVLRSSKRLSNSPHRYKISPYCVLKKS